MDLYLKAETEIGDLVIDYIEVELGSGKTVSLNWEESFVDRVGKDLYAHYCGICFDKVDANGRLKELKGMKIIDVGTYSEEFGEGQHPFPDERTEQMKCRSFIHLFTSCVCNMFHCCKNIVYQKEHVQKKMKEHCSSRLNVFERKHVII